MTKQNKGNRMRLGIVMDPIAKINYGKDSTLAMLWEAQKRGMELFYFEPPDLYLTNDRAFGRGQKLTVFRDEKCWFEFAGEETLPLDALNIILMRKDPPFNMNYIYLTYLLEAAHKRGVVVVNNPQSLRDANEKIFITEFADCMPQCLVTSSNHRLHQFWQQHSDIVIKPLDSMGGASIFRVTAQDHNANVIFEALTKQQTRIVMAQQFIPEIAAGDKRVLIIDGEIFPHALCRVPQANDWRGNLAVGAKAVVQPLSKRDWEISQRVATVLRARELYFVGIDIIGNYLTEINVTSPTGIRELDQALGTNISAQLFDALPNQ